MRREISANGRKQVVAITGASAGVGRATVREFAAHGASIGLIARDTEGLANAETEACAGGNDALAAPTDVSDADAVEAAAEAIENRLGPIDVWVNDAMTTIFSRFIDIKPEEYRRATEVTYLGAVWGTMSALRRMYPRDNGVIVQVGSALAYRSIPLQSPYCGAKHAIMGFTDSIRTELIHDRKNIHITMVHLPAMNTPQFGWCKSNLPSHPQPVPPIFQPEVAARAIYQAAHQRRRQVYVGGPTLFAVMANKIAPGIADEYLGHTGYDSQQTGEQVDPNRPNNLFEPVPGDAGAHGIFGARSHAHSAELWATENRALLSLGGLSLASFALAAILRK